MAAVKVSLQPEALALRPGETADVDVTIQNAGQAVEHFTPSIVGLPGELCRFEPSVVKLRPGESGAVRAKLTLPERSSLVDGVYTLGVLVRSPYQSDVSRCEELRVDVLAAPGLSLTAHPEIAQGGRRGSYTLSVTNDGNTPLLVSLHASDPEAIVGYAFRPRTMEVAPGGTGSASLTVDASPPWTGQDQRRPINVRAVAGAALEAQQAVTFVQRPRIRGGVLRLVGMATGVAVLAAATIGAALLTRAKQEARPPAVPTPVVVSVPAVVAAPPTSAGPAVVPPPPSAAPSTSSAPPAAGTTIVDFTQLPGGGPPGNQIIAPDLYAQAGGVTLSTVVDNAPAACQDASALALRTVKTLGSFLTSARPAGVDLCNAMPVRMKFKSPARALSLAYIGTGKQYAITVELVDGSTRRVAGVAAEGATATLVYDAGSPLIVSVTFGHTNPDPNAKGESTLIKKLTYRA